MYIWFTVITWSRSTLKEHCFDCCNCFLVARLRWPWQLEFLLPLMRKQSTLWYIVLVFHSVYWQLKSYINICIEIRSLFPVNFQSEELRSVQSRKRYVYIGLRLRNVAVTLRLWLTARLSAAGRSNLHRLFSHLQLKEFFQFLRNCTSQSQEWFCRRLGVNSGGS